MLHEVREISKVTRKTSAKTYTCHLTQIVAYADDVALLARSLKALKEIFHKLQNKATLVGLNINEDKTKYMQIKRKGIKYITHPKIDFSFEHVESFNYLGSILNADNKINIEIVEKNNEMQQSILCQFKTNKIKIP
jgi:hypothetical protein